MEATFYGVLGVPPDADDQTIVRAFRERAKAKHPDVNDSPDATAAFKRLQTAREVLTDEAERERYDRLGHAAYLRRTEDCPGWAVPEADSDATKPAQAAKSGEPADGTTRASTGGRTATAATQRYTDPDSEATNRQAPQSRQGSSVAGTGTATAYYQPGQRTNPGSTGSVDTLVGVARSVGVWAAVHVLLVLSAVATAWLILSWGAMSPVSLVLATVVLAAALAVSTLHVSIRVYP